MNTQNNYKLQFHNQPYPTLSQFNSLLKHLTKTEFQQLLHFQQRDAFGQPLKSHENPKCIEYCLMRALRSEFYEKYHLDASLNQPNLYGKYDIHSDKNIHYNWSHDSFVAFLEGSKEVGVDIFNTERFNNKPFHLFYDNLKGFLTSKEQQKIEECGNDDKMKTMIFGKIWCCKEAFVKTIGIGLNDIISTFDIDLDCEIHQIESSSFETNKENTIDISQWYNCTYQYNGQDVYLYIVLIDQKYYCAFGLFDKINEIKIELRNIFE